MSGGKMLRVLHVIGGMDRGGAETMIMNLYRNIDRSSIQFDFLCLNDGEHSYDEEIGQLGGRIFHIPPYKKLGVIRTVMAMKGILTRYGPYSAVHSHVLYFSGVSMLAARLTGIPQRICHAHSTSDGKKSLLSRKVYRALMRFSILTNSTHRLACSCGAGKYLYGNGFSITGGNLVIKNAIDVTQYDHMSEAGSVAKREELGIPLDTLLIGHVGNFRREKNHEFLIRLASYMKSIGLDFRLVLVGGGGLKHDIEDQVKEKALSDVVTFLGIRSDIPDLMNAFDVFLLPSFYEGIPVSVIEAQAACTPCVLSKFVPGDVDIGAGFIQYLSLDAELDTWTRAIQDQAKVSVDRKKLIEKIRGSGYDVRVSAKTTSRIYLNIA